MKERHNPVVEQELAALKISKVLDEQQAEKRGRYGKTALLGFGAAAAGLLLAIPAGIAFTLNPLSATAAGLYLTGALVSSLGLSFAFPGVVGRAANRPSEVPLPR